MDEPCRALRLVCVAAAITGILVGCGLAPAPSGDPSSSPIEPPPSDSPPPEEPGEPVDPQPEPDPDTSPPVVPATASLEGQLLLQPGDAGTTRFEEEPNDSTDAPQLVGDVAPGDRIVMIGRVAAFFDVIDAFQFEASERIRVSFVLDYAGDGATDGAQFDVGVADFENRNCFPGDTDAAAFAQCFSSDTAPEVGFVDVGPGPFVVAVVAEFGFDQYQLELMFEDPSNEQDGALAVGSATAFAPAPAPTVPDEVLVMFEPWADEATRGAVLAAAGLSLIEASPSGLCRTRRTEDAVAGKDVNTAARRARTRAAAAALAGDPAVRCAAPNYIRRIARTPNDEYYDLQWHYPLINLPEAWDLTTGSDDVIVAAIDTGIVTSHPDLQGRVVDGYDFIADLATANDGDGRDADPNDPGDSFGGPGLSSFHGTHVAGTIAATTDNGVGVAGVTFHTRLMPIRAIGVGGGSDFDIAESIRYAAGLANISGRTPAEPADIINMSFSGGAGAGASEVIRVAIRDAANAGLVLVAAAGNEGNELRSYPAAFDEVIAVGAVNLSQLRAAYSNFGSWLSVMAPGGNIGTDFNGDGWADGVLSTGASDAGGNLQYQYRFENGTSMAAPHVSGLTALILAADPHLTAQEVRDILESTARDLGPPGVDDEYGHGLIDALAAVREARRRLGDVNSDEPQLSLSTTTLDFGTQFAELRVAVSNTGGGFLQVSGVTVETLDGDGWLSVQTEGSTDAASVSQIVVRVDRTGLDVGVYGGRVTVAADGVDARTIDVSVSVGTGPDLDELVFVLAVEPDTLVTVGQTATDVAREYQYVLDELPAGRYAVYAGTDRDEDGVICEPGDLCGALPSRIEPAIIELQEGETISGADFAVALNVVRQSAGPPADAIVLRRIE